MQRITNCISMFLIGLCDSVSLYWIRKILLVTHPSNKKIHPTERPVEMVQEVIQTFGWEGCRVMIPFLGSGNTLLAASNLGMSAFGYDLSEEYKNAYIVRVNEARPGSYKSYREV